MSPLICPPAGTGKFWGGGTGTGTAALHCRDLFFFFFGVRARFGGLRLTYSALYVICTLDGTAHNFVSKIKNYSKNSPMGGKGEQTTGRKRSCWITLRTKAGAPRRFVRAFARAPWGSHSM